MSADRRRGLHALAAAAFGAGLRLLRKAAPSLVTVALLALAAVMLAPPLLGYERYVITGGSMGEAYERGSILYARAVPIEELRIGDVITYDPPPKANVEGLVTHRIVSIVRDDGELAFATKGDANEHRDPWQFTLDGPTQARAELELPYLGYAFAALAIREVRIALIGLPALIIALVLVARLWREAGEEARLAATATPPEAEPERS